MILSGRELKQGSSGADIGQLHSALAQLGYAVPAAEQQGSSFGAGTQAAVEQFQTAHSLPVTGVVDAATAAAMSAVIVASTYTATGTVTSPVRAGVGGLAVQLVDKNVGADTVLASGTTGADGSYRITAVVSAASLRARHKTSPDLQVHVSAGSTVLASSAVSYDAPLAVTLDIRLPADAVGLPSEYESLVASLASLYPGKLGTLQETDTRQDITYLANKSGWDARAVALAALADQFSSQVAPAAAAPATPSVALPPSAGTPAASTQPPAAAAPPPTLKPEFYYALFRAGLPANADSLFQASSAAVQAIWQQAVAQGVIPQALGAEIPGAVQTFQALSAASRLDAKPRLGLSTLRQMLQPILADAGQQTQFARLYAQYGNDPARFWTEVQSAFGAGTAKQLQFQGQLCYLTLDNQPLVAALAAAERQSPPTSTLDLATRGYHDPAKWTPLIDSAIPPQIPGATADEQRANYAALLAAQVRVAHPTAVLADLVQRGTLPLAGTTARPADVAGFLAAHQGSFEIGIEPVEAFIARSKITGTASAVVAEIKRLQRVYQISPDDRTMTALLQQKLDSASAIARHEQASFTRSFAAALGGEAAAREIHARAKQVHNAVLNVAVSYLLARQAPVLGGAAPTQRAYAPPPPNPAYPVIAYPTLENLFGSLDYCDCQDCRSILSPAAYLVDLLNSLDIPSPSPGYQNPQDVLFQRRPDLQHLPLTCENTNTALPYIDLVNEVLEYFVANNLSLASYQGHDTGSAVTSAELTASPQNVNDAAYATLEGVFFPPPLPFDRPLALLRLHLEAIGVTLRDAMAALRPSDAIERGTAPYGWRDILMEQLKISREDYRLFTDGTLKLQGLYGYPGLSDSAVLATLQTTSLQDFSRRTGVSYADLFAIVRTRFINPNAALIPRLQQLHMPFAALQTLKNGASDPSVVAAFKAALPVGLDARQYGGSSPTDLDAVVRWVTNAQNYARIMRIVTITDPTGEADPCSAAALQFRYSDPDNSANALTATDFVKLIRFIRLWQKLGLGIEQTDRILAALYPAADLPTGSNDATDLLLLDAGFLILLPRLGFLKQVMGMLGVSADTALAPLLACWAPIDTIGTDSLYAGMFLSPTLAEPDAAFADDGYGDYLGNTAEPLLNHEATLRAAFNLTGAEFALITGNATPGSLAFGPTTPLTLAHISAIFRIGWLAHALGLSVLEFLLLRSCWGLDPFAALDPGATPPAEPPAVRFIRGVQAFAAAGLRPVQALYLLWNQDISGTSAPTVADVTGLAVALRADFAAVEEQFTLVDDPDGSIAKRLMSLVYGTSATDSFFGLLNNTLVTSVPCAAAQPGLAQPIIDASAGRLSYDDLRKELSFAGLLDATTQAAIDQAITGNGNDAALHAALASLATACQQAVGPFFATYPELLPLYHAYVASTAAPQDRRTALLANVLPSLKQDRKREQALASITAAAGADPSFATTLLQDATILHAAASATDAASVDLTRIETEGLSAAFFLANNPAAPPDQTVEAATSLDYGPGSANTLPPGSGGSPITGVWSGYLDVPQAGFYNIAVTADAGAAVTLAIDGASVPMAASGTVWRNQGPISLVAGAPAAIRLTGTSLKETFSVKWESAGSGWAIIPQRYLYSATLVDRLRTTYVRFLKAVALAAALSFTAEELAYLARATRFGVSTSDKTDAVAAGSVTLTPASMANIAVGTALVIDSGAAQEVVTVTAVTATGFTATTTKAHDGTATPFPITDLAFGGQGWLNALPVLGTAGQATASALGSVLSALLDVSRIKRGLSPGDSRLLAVLENPALTLSDGSLALLTLTGWARESVEALLQHFFGGTQLAALGTIAGFGRVYDAYAVVRACRVSAAALIASVTNAPTPAAVGALQSALRALYAESDWLAVVKPINDAMRLRQRDALVAYILQQLGDGRAETPVTATTTMDAPAGSTAIALASTANIAMGMSVRGPNIPAGAVVAAISGTGLTLSAPTAGDVPSGSSLAFVVDTSIINTAEKLFEFFLIDVETQPPVNTSRIRLALSSVQLFIERVLRNLEPQVQPSDLATLAAQWPWMKRYRVWQANREVFLWPENWLYPELRDDQSPFFREIMGKLLQGDITDEAAEGAYLDYLTSLEEVAKLEPCGIYYLPQARDSEETAYVVARTAGANRKYYFRQLQYGAWTPWSQVKIDCEDMPLTPLVWKGRLFLFWLKLIKQATPQTSDSSSLPPGPVSGLDLGQVQSYAQQGSQAQRQVKVQAMLCWSELYNGKWQPTKTSDVSRPTGLGMFDVDGPGAIEADRSLMRISPVALVEGAPPVIPADALILGIGSPLSPFWPSGGFVLYNSHSLPVRFEDIRITIRHGISPPLPLPIAFCLATPPRGRTMAPIEPYSGGSLQAGFSIDYWSSTGGGKTSNFNNTLIGFNWMPRSVEPQLGLADAWDAPFFYEDRQHLFYVTTAETYKTIRIFTGFGTVPAGATLAAPVAPLPPIVVRPPAKPVPSGPIVTGNLLGGGDPAAIEDVLTRAKTMRAALGTTQAVTYQGRQIYPTDSADAPAQPQGE